MPDRIPETETVLRVAGGATDELVDALRDATSEHVLPVGSTGLSALEPLLAVTTDGRTAFYASCSTNRAVEVARGLAEGDLPEPDTTADGGGASLPSGGPFDSRHVLAGCGWRRPTEPADYEDAGGFAFEDADADDAFDAAQGLLGRGWGDGARDASVGALWEDAVEANGDPAVVVNAHGTDADRLLVESDPFSVLDGAALAARALAANEAYVFVSEDDGGALETARAAADAFPGDLEIEVVAGQPTYKAAEPTMAIESIEGNHRLEARLRPPGPERAGLHGRPTLVHTPRTLAQVAANARGDGANTRLVTVTGDVTDEATVELPADGTLADARAAVDVTGSFKAACVGGRFGGLTDTLDVGVTPDALSGADLGTEGVVEVLNTERCPVEFVGKRARLAAETNCGRCVPCREGSTQLAELLRDLYDGTYEAEKLRELSRVMESSSICAFGRDAPRPVRTAMDAFESEFEAHADGECPAGACTAAMEVSQ